jgi:hypothetical protein
MEVKLFAINIIITVIKFSCRLKYLILVMKFT